MGRLATGLAYALVMVAVIIGVDVLFLRQHTWLRLAVNIAIVAVFAAIYLRFVRR